MKGSDGFAPAIVAEGLGKRLGPVTALDGIDLEVRGGTVLGLLGPNGAGKTTVSADPQRHTPARHGPRPRAGVRPGARGRRGARPDRAGRPVGAVDGNLTGRENLRLIGRLTHLPRGEVRRRAAELLEAFGLEDAADRPARTYSGGMRRRPDLAVALVHRPPVVFLDEPTTGLDPESRGDLWRVVEELVAEGTAVLLTTQYLEEADRRADRIVVVDRGRAIAEGAAAELKRRLGATVMEFGMADAGAAAAAGAALDSLALDDVAVEDRLVRAAAGGGAHALLAAMRALDSAGLSPQTAAIREPTLDDVFLSLTGRRTEPGEDAPAAAAPVHDARQRSAA